MNIPQGYKQTELGIIPEDWEVKSFSQIFDMYPNNTYPRDCMNDSRGVVRNIHYGDVLIKYPTIIDVEKCAIPYLNEDVKIKLQKLVQSGDIIIADTAEDETVGKCVEIKNVGNNKIVAGLHTFFCRPTSLFAAGWLGYYINSTNYHNQLIPYITGIKVSSISRTAIQETKLLVPPIAEQRAIAEALSDMDGLIAALDKKIAKKRLLKQGAMQQLLTGKKRLPSFTDKWVEITFGEYVDIYRGGSPRPIESYITDSPNGVNWIKIGDVKPNDKYINKTEERIIPDGVSRSRRVDVGDFILSNSMSFGRPYILGIDGCIHDGWLVIQNYHNSFDKDYLYYLLCSEDVMMQYIGMAAGSSVKNLNKEKVASLQLCVPTTIEEQQAIATILSDMDKEIADLEAQRDKYRLLKSGMMQKLLTGQIRLKTE